MIRGPRGGTEGYAADIRRAVSAVSGGLPITQMQTLQQVYDKSMSRTAFTLTLLRLRGDLRGPDGRVAALCVVLVTGTGIWLAPPLIVGQREFDDIEQRLRAVLIEAENHL